MVSCFRRGRGQDRRLEFEETAVLHAAADRIDDLPALHDVPVQPLAAQIEEAVLQADVFRIFLVAENRHRQFRRRTQHLDLGRKHLDLPGRQIGIVGTRRAGAHLAVDPHHPFRAQRLGRLEGRAVGIGHDLGQAVMVAQVDEQQAAMIADAVAPAGDAHRLANMGVAELAAGVGAIAMHVSGIRGIAGLRAAKSAWGSVFVKASRKPRHRGIDLQTQGRKRFGRRHDQEDDKIGPPTRDPSQERPHDHRRGRCGLPDRAWAGHHLRAARRP
jgi:hypothetical protein